MEEDLVEEEPEKPEEIIDKDKDIEEKKVMGLEKEDSNDKNQKKHRKHRKRSRSHSKHKDHKGKDKNNWRKIVKTKKSRSKSREKGKTEEKIDNQEKKQGKIEEFSVEYWNKLRAEIGLKPL